MAYLRPNKYCPWYVYHLLTNAKTPDDEILVIEGVCQLKYSEAKNIKTIDDLIELCKQKDKSFNPDEYTEDELKDLIHAVFKFVEDVKQEYNINN